MSDKARKKIKRTIHNVFESGASRDVALRKVYKIADDDSEWEDEEEEEDEEEYEDGYDEEEESDEEEDDEEEGSGSIIGDILELLPDEEE